MSLPSFIKLIFYGFIGGTTLTGCTSFFLEEEKNKISSETHLLPLQKDISCKGASLVGEEKESPFQKEFKEKLDKVLSFQISSSLPLREILQDLLDLGGIEGEISPEITTQATVSFHHRPLREILHRLCERHQLRLIFQPSYVQIEPDQSFLKTYSLPFLSLKRSGRHQMGVATDVFNGRKKGEENGSSSFLTAESTIDFWQEISTNLAILLEEDKDKKEGKKNSSFTLHKQGGLIVVKATKKQHDLIASYLDHLKDQCHTQVLIEAKIMEVALDESYKHGINWKLITRHLGVWAPSGEAPHLFPSQKDGQEFFTFTAGGKDMNVLVDFLETFGTSRTLSNPRLTVMNNQSALLKVARNYVYFTLNYTKNTPGFPTHPSFVGAPFYYDPPTTHVTSEVHTVPIGLVMTVQASLNEKNQEITLVLRPTITTIVGHVEDPAVAILSEKKAHSRIPLVEVRELDTILKTSSGEVVVVGGLMRTHQSQKESGVPGLSSVPLGEFLFSGGDEEKQMTELVILIRATLLSSPSLKKGPPSSGFDFFPSPQQERVFHEKKDV